MECHISPVGGEADGNVFDGGSECLEDKVHNNRKGVDSFIEKMGLRVVNGNGDPVMLFEYLGDQPEDICAQPKKTLSKGRRELRNLEWEMNDG